MRLVIDMQGAQSRDSRNRGIGRYTLALCKEMCRLRGGHEVILSLNGLFPDTIEPIRAAFSGLVPEENICVWEAVGPVHAADSANDARRNTMELVREAFLAGLKPDIVLTTSLFEGLIDNAITSVGNFSGSLPTAVILYDLIPLIYRTVYLQNPVVECWYEGKIEGLKRSDLLLSISASSGREAVEHLNFPAEKVINISTACEEHFRPRIVENAERLYLQQTYGLTRPFVMYTGGIDHRKNIEGLIRAYAGLSAQIRAEHQLAVVCSIQPSDRERLLQLAKREGMTAEELVITGFVSEDDLVALCNTCKLFVFPSWHEGFGLPALEAMACGRAVIGSNTSSIPEVIGREDALFDPFDDSAIARKMTEVLTNEKFRIELEQYGLKRAREFSWQQSAQCAWQALEAFIEPRQQTLNAPLSVTAHRPRLAYISPLPPEQSGIADYSSELLPELAKHYDVEVVVAQKEVVDPWILANCPIRDVNWFRDNADYFDRVLYHFGNSPFHGHMFELLAEIPGIVVLHEFFLSHIVGHLDYLGFQPFGWTRALAHAHGWPAVQARYQAEDCADVIWKYPCNFAVLQQSLGVIVHSEYQQRLAESWYGKGAADQWEVIPLLRIPATKANRNAARRRLGLKGNKFVVCSFGMMGPTKLNHRLLSAWLDSPLSKDVECHLVFVGQNHDGVYGFEQMRAIKGCPAAERIKITGRVGADVYRDWLFAADVGVQLRTLSRGETSAAVLDCMNYGLATIVNANGSMADLPNGAVWMLPDAFSDEELVEALTTLWQRSSRRRTLGRRACEMVHSCHNPRHCAEKYRSAIENFYGQAAAGLPTLLHSLERVEPPLPVDEWPLVAASLAGNFPPQPRRKQLFLDVSILVQHDAKSGIQRVVRSLLHELLHCPPAGWAVEPTFATGDKQGYPYARRFTSRFLDVPDDWAEDDPIDAWQGDVFLGLDLQHAVLPLQKDYLSGLHRRGVKVHFIVYDLLPVLMPQVFSDGMYEMHQRWLETVSHFDGVVCISRAVASEFTEWQRQHDLKRIRPFKVNWFHLGADVENSVPTRGLPENAGCVLKELSHRSTFLTVGTIEPRKCQSFILDAFEYLWNQGHNVNLVIVGKQGWKMEALVEELRNHCELGRRLFWLEGISDEYLEKIYAASTCLIAASEGEGFGLPLIEAAQHKKPIIARDIPVFREVAGDHAFYFEGLDPEALATAVKNWVVLYSNGNHPKSNAMPWLTWKQSAQQLLEAVLVE